VTVPPPRAGFPHFPPALRLRLYFSICQRSTGRSSRAWGLPHPSTPRAGVPGTPAKGLRPLMRPTVCFGVGRFTLTRSSWPAPPRCSRKWMSGYAGQALTENEDRRQFGKTTQIILALGESSFPSEGKSPFPLDFYLSWMSPISEVKMESLLLSCRALSSPTMSRLIPALGCPLPP
jgi:hypothetical protein